MSGTFSLGFVIAASLSSNFTSAMLGTQRAMKKLEDGTGILKRRQQELLSHARQYGISAAQSAAQVRNEYQRLGHELKNLTALQTKLTDVTNRGKMLREQRSVLMGQTTGFAARVAIIATPFIKAAKGYAQEESQATSIAQGTGDFSPAFKQHVIRQARKNSMETAQSTSDILSIADTLTDAQWSQSDIDKVTTLIGRTATTYKQDVSVFTNTAETLSKTFGYTSDQMQHAFNLLAKGGNTVGFELPDLAPALKELGPLLEQSGLKGDEALKQVMAAAGAARKTLAKEDVLPGMQQWLASIDKKNLSARYKAMGVEYEKSRADYAKNGYSDFEASILISQRYLEAKGGKGFAGQFAALGDNAEAQQTLINNLGMGQIFSSPEQIRFLQAMIKNMDTYKKNKEAISKSQDDNYINKNYAEHAKDLATKMQLLKNETANTWSVLGQQLAPALKQNIEMVTGLVKSVGEFISQNPSLIQGIAAGVKGFFMFKRVMLGARFAMNYGRTVRNFGGTLFTLGKTFRTLSRSAGFARAALTMLQGSALYKTGQLMAKLTKGGWSLAKVLSGGLVKGLMLAGRAVLFLSRALAANPIGLIIMGIAGAAFLIYKYWTPISGFFKRLWEGVKILTVSVWNSISGFFSRMSNGITRVAASVFTGLRGFFSGLWNDIRGLFSGGIGNLAKTIINWSPVGLFYKCFAGVMKYFGADLPGSFTEFGKNIINGLAGGISASFSAVQDKITGIADSVKNTFKGWLGINSPSTVFMGYGSNISEGLAMGIESKKGVAGSAMKSLHSEINKQQADLPEIARPGSAGSQRPAGGKFPPGSSGDIHLTFSPVINLPGGARAEIRESLRACLPELEAVLRDILYQQQRRSFSAA